MELLPTDVVYEILRFSGHGTVRRGFVCDSGRVVSPRFIFRFDENDIRYTTLKMVIAKKLRIVSELYVYDDGSFYVEFRFDADTKKGMIVDYGVNEKDVIEICYLDMRKDYRSPKRLITTYFR